MNCINGAELGIRSWLFGASDARILQLENSGDVGRATVVIQPPGPPEYRTAGKALSMGPVRDLRIVNPNVCAKHIHDMIFKAHQEAC